MFLWIIENKKEYIYHTNKIYKKKEKKNEKTRSDVTSMIYIIYIKKWNDVCKVYKSIVLDSEQCIVYIGS